MLGVPSIWFDLNFRLAGLRDNVGFPSSLSSLVHVVVCAVVCVLALPVVLYGHVSLFRATRRKYPHLKFTALKIVAMRAELCRMGLRDDPLSEKLLRALPWVPHFARRCAFAYFGLISRFNMVWHHYPITDGDLNKIRWRDVVSLRTQLIDETIRESDAAQLVILGAGFDTRALQPLSTVASRFEIDFPPTQEAKVAAVAAAGIDASNTIFVGVDFNKGESWLDKLKEAGFDPKKKTVFVWEGVTYYLEPQAVSATVELVKQCCSGTVIVFDYFSHEVVQGKMLAVVSSTLRAMGEPLLCGIGTADDEGAPRKWVEQHGLKLGKSLRGGTKGERWGGVLSASVP